MPASNKSVANIAPDRKKISNADITCFYWTEDKCRYTAETCRYQHRHTGIVADPPQFNHQSKFGGHNTNSVSREPNTVHSTVAHNTTSASAQLARLFHGIHPDRLGLLSNEGMSGAKDTEMADADPLQRTNDCTPHPPPAVTEKSPVHQVDDRLAADLSCLQLKHTIEETVKIKFDDLFGWSSSGNSVSMVNRRAILLYHPEDHSEELEVITRWLLMHYVEVSSAWYNGSWDYFRQQILKGRSGIILVSSCCILCM